MICWNCREQRPEANIRHKYCVNNWGKDPKDELVLVKRPEPINACACQHEESWNFVTNKASDQKETKDTNGDSKES